MERGGRLARDHRGCDRRWHEPWDYRERLLDVAAARLDELYAAAGRGAGDTADPALLAALCEDLDVPHAVDLAVAEGGPTARTLLAVLGLQ